TSDDVADQSSDEAVRSGKLFDLEAADSDDETSASQQSQVEDDVFFFPQFRSLPYELRLHIWQIFCPDITAKSRVYEFHGTIRHGRYQSEKLIVEDGPFLEHHTRPVRTLLAIHRE